MRRVGLALSWLLSLHLLLVPLRLCAAEGGPPIDAGTFASQSTGDEGPRLNLQPHPDSSTLEVAPQSSGGTPPDASPDSAARTFHPSDDVAAIDRSHQPAKPDDGKRPYLGLELELTTQCLFGMEMRGFEVVTIAPKSPASRAGLEARKPSTPLGELKAFGSLLVFPVALFTVPRLRRSGALGMPGDLIVAVDDRRVRTEDELMRALDPLRAGDVVYLTVIRPVIGGGHQTLRIALHIDETLDPSKFTRSP